MNPLTYDRSGWAETDRGQDIWRFKNDHGDLMTQWYFPSPDPPPFRLDEVQSFRDFSRQLAAQTGGGLVEGDRIEQNGLVLFRSILKYGLPTGGFGFAGSFAFYANGEGHSIKVECYEGQPTGTRETAVALKLGITNPNPGFLSRLLSGVTGKKPQVWFEDPYDPRCKTPVMRSRADAARWDAEFPDHPLSRLRRHLARIGASLTVGAKVSG